MTSEATHGQRSIKVPRENNRYLCWPPAHTALQLIERNRSGLDQSLLPNEFSGLRELGRAQALAKAHQHTFAYTSLEIRIDPQSPLIVSGHQPELFHPGVWFKNFLLHALARNNQSQSLHVLIDHDIAKSDTLRIPAFVAPSSTTQGGYEQTAVPLPLRLDSQTRLPWHLTRCDLSSFRQWDEVASSIVKSLANCGIHSPIVQNRLDLLKDCLRLSNSIGAAFSQFRHRIEIENGVTNLEVSLGALCSDTAFGRFVQQCSIQASSLWTIYNESRIEYRSKYAIKNQAQPVLELQRVGDALELPFWIYRSNAESIDRKRLWLICRSDDKKTMILGDATTQEHCTIQIELPTTPDQIDSAWREIATSGICVRPRALMTTIYLRCFVADLFVHGIGGGVYDELTDQIIARWLKVTPPAYLISSASLHLPFTQGDQDSQLGMDWSQLQQRLQWMRSVPERFLNVSIPGHQEILQQHTHLLANIPQRGSKKRWHQEIFATKAQIVSLIEPQKKELIAQCQAWERNVQQDRIRKSREYSFVLYPEEDVVHRLKNLANEAQCFEATRNDIT